MTMFTSDDDIRTRAWTEIPSDALVKCVRDGTTGGYELTFGTDDRLTLLLAPHALESIRTALTEADTPPADPAG
ncbi:MAG TPA: hypothetical protein VGL93_27980 [Streptosporangiaceae bacterium]|jgi:hypothetical protein